LLIAVLALAATFGTTSFDSLLGPTGVSTLSGGAAFAIGLLLLLGTMGKSAQVPLHVWLPDAMEGPTTVSALIHAATMVNAGVFLLLRMYPLISLPSLGGALSSLVVSVGLLSALVGGASALASDDIKRVLAYSTISQLGLMFAAIGFGSIDAAAYHMISQGLFKALAFLAAGSVVTALGTREIDKMGGLARALKFTYIGFLVSVLAMSGVPPLVGFWSKDAILQLAFLYSPVASLTVIGVFALTVLYSFRVLLRVFHGHSKLNAPLKEAPPSMLAPIGVLAVAVLTAWGVLQSQTLLSFASFWTPEVLPVATSLAVLGSSALLAYALCLRFRPQMLLAMQRSPPLLALSRLLSNGFYFDRVYGAAARVIFLPLARGVARIQTDLLRANALLALATVAIIFVLFASGIL
ncbi:MAG TPA: proton-conducting transporter membrane subunit, partial [Nitrososphaerales archaeon]|nr:proton-conducting transporter membrane subunit [Nitrososphaerales archaeon]